jgi:MYXO-CTERM domain-containing protein
MRARRRLHSFGVVVAPVVCSLAFASSDAQANGRLPAAHQLVVSPTDPNLFVLEATFGVFTSRDMGATFGWICEPAIGYPSNVAWDPSIGITASSILASIPAGVSVSADQGCSWQVTLPGHFIDIVVRRDDPHSALALASTYSGRTDAGGNAFLTQVFATHDDGATWAQQGASIDSDVQVETIEVAPRDPNTIYIGGARTSLGADGSLTTTGIVFVSTNGGASYNSTSIALQEPQESESSAFVSAVDPTDPQRVYVRISQSASSLDRLIVSDDGAATFRTAYQARGALPGFALSSDGSKVFVGDSVSGVLLASPPPVGSGAPFSFAQRSPAVVACLTWAGGSLYACTGEPQHPNLKELGVSTDDGLTFSQKFIFGCFSGPLSCPSGAVASTCSAGLGSLHALIGACPDGGSSTDAGEPDSSVPNQDAGHDAGAEAPRLRSPSCGCRAGEATGEVGGLSVIALLVATALRRRRA